MTPTDVFFWGALSAVTAANLMTTVGDTLPDTMPQTRDFFEVHGIEAVRVGDTAALFVDRTIHQPIPMSFTVRVMEAAGDQWSLFCYAEGQVIEYSPSAVISDPNAPLDGAVGLDWWTYGKCPVLPDGEAQIRTTWTPQAFGLYPVSFNITIPEESPYE